MDSRLHVSNAYLSGEWWWQQEPLEYFQKLFIAFKVKVGHFLFQRLGCCSYEEIPSTGGVVIYKEGNKARCSQLEGRDGVSNLSVSSHSSQILFDTDWTWHSKQR